MDTMQNYREWLVGAQPGNDQQRRALVRLTQVSAEQLLAFENDLAWETWGEPETAAAATSR